MVCGMLWMLWEWDAGRLGHTAPFAWRRRAGLFCRCGGASTGVVGGRPCRASMSATVVGGSINHPQPTPNRPTDTANGASTGPSPTCPPRHTNRPPPPHLLLPDAECSAVLLLAGASSGRPPPLARSARAGPCSATFTPPTRRASRADAAATRTGRASTRRARVSGGPRAAQRRRATGELRSGELDRRSTTAPPRPTPM